MQTPLLELRPSKTEDATPVLAAPIWAQLGNVVPFARPNTRRSELDLPPAVVVVPSERAPVAPGDRAQRRLVALLVLSFTIHAGVVALLWRPPEPLPGIELAPLTVEIVVTDGAPGATSPTAPTPAEASKEPDLAQPAPQTAQPVIKEETQDAPVEDKALTAPDSAQESSAPAQDPIQPAQKAEQAPVKPDPAPVEQAQPLASPEQLRPPEPALKPEPIVPSPPLQTHHPPPETKAAPAPPPQPTQAEPTTAPVRKQEPARSAKQPTPPVPARRSEHGINDNAANAKPKAAAPARQSSADPNYRGIVFAHLSRFKRMPPDAQRNHSQGTAVVSFVISGSGQVGAVHLARGSGVASLDQEVLAMPRRASPFPAPRDGKPVAITAPVSFRF